MTTSSVTAKEEAKIAREQQASAAVARQKWHDKRVEKAKKGRRKEKELNLALLSHKAGEVSMNRYTHALAIHTKVDKYTKQEVHVPRVVAALDVLFDLAMDEKNTPDLRKSSAVSYLEKTGLAEAQAVFRKNAEEEESAGGRFTAKVVNLQFNVPDKVAPDNPIVVADL